MIPDQRYSEDSNPDLQLDELHGRKPASETVPQKKAISRGGIYLTMNGGSHETRGFNSDL